MTEIYVAVNHACLFTRPLTYPLPPLTHPPQVAFTFAYNLDLEPGVALGFFALGCAPGGSSSNVWTNFLGGNLNLSITMTLCSTMCALGESATSDDSEVGQMKGSFMQKPLFPREVKMKTGHVLRKCS